MSRSEKEVKTEVLENVYRQMDLSRELSDREVEELVQREVMAYSRQYPLTLRTKNQISRQVFNSLRGLDILQELVDDETVSEIMINGPKQIFIERAGELQLWDKQFDSEEKLLQVIQQIVGKTNRIVNEANPICDSRLENGSRVNVVLPPIALEGAVVTIRRFPDNPFTMEDLIKRGTLSRQVAEFLRDMVVAGENIFISGGTSSGKTTFLNVMANYIPSGERVITIEDSAELCIKNVENLVRLEARMATAEGKHQVSIRDLIRSSLRMRPDRIIVGEVRGGEALDMVSAMNSGHDGSLSTGHGNSCRDMIRRLEVMIMMGMELTVDAIRGQIASAIDLMVHLERGRDGVRRLVAIEELVGYENGQMILNPIYRYNPEVMGDEAWERLGELENREKIKRI